MAPALTLVEVVILAGGRGTRLSSRLNGRPKPLVEVAGTPLLARQLSYCRFFGARRVLILVNHLAEKVREFCHANDDFGLEVTLIDDGQPRGTAGATLAAWPYFSPATEDLLIIYGDTLLNVDLDRFLAFHRARNAATSLLVHPNNHPYDSDLLELDERGRILQVHPYPRTEDRDQANLVNAALYLIKRQTLEPWLYLADQPPMIIDFAKNLFPEMLARGQEIYGYLSAEYIKDIGTPERLDQAEADIISGRFQQGSLSQARPAVFLDRDGVINEDIGHIFKVEQFRLLPGVPGALKRLNQSGLLSVVVTNQPVIARGDCNENELRRIFNHMETLLGRDRAYLDRIYYCPHHPDNGFAGERSELKFKCECRKPEIGLLRRAQEEMNIDLEGSWFIGDRTSDWLCASRAGVTSMAVSTGAAGRDGAYPVAPDFRAADLLAAVDFILDTYPQLVRLTAPWLADIRPGEIILIGGLAHSGKSTLASVLERELRKRGLKVCKICLDGFLKSVQERGPTVLERYDLPAINALARRVMQGSGAVSLPFYQRHSRSVCPEASSYELTPGHVLILEGVPALALPLLGKISSRRFGVICSAEIRRQRFREEYQRREEGEEWAELFQRREQEERPTIEQSLTKDVTIISMDSRPGPDHDCS